MRRNIISKGLVAGTTLLLGAAVGVGAVHAAPAPAAPAPSVFTLPLPVPLVVTVSTGAGGAITDVTVDPNDITQLKARPGKVAFVNNADGVKVSVGSHGQSQSISARGGSLASFSNASGGGWSGDVFADGTAWHVPFVVGGTDTAPTITIGTVTGGTSEVIPTTVSTDGHHDGHHDGNSVEAKAGVKFTSADGSLSRRLSIRVSVEAGGDADNDGDTKAPSASLRISLDRVRGVPQTAAQVTAGPHTWTGMLCDNSTAMVKYSVAADGTITIAAGDVTPATATVKIEGTKAMVSFAKHQSISIHAKVDNAGLITVNVSERIRCSNAPAPTINGQPATVTTTTTAPGTGGSQSGHHNGHGGRRGKH